MGDLWVQVLTRDEPDLVTLTRQFRTKVATEDVDGYEAGDRARHPSDVGLHDDAALLYLEIGKPERAIEHFQRSVMLKGDSAPAHFNLGTAYTVAHQFDQAVAEYQLAIRIDPDYANAHNNLGNVRLAQKHPDLAIRRVPRSGASPAVDGVRARQSRGCIRCGRAIRSRARIGGRGHRPDA